MQTAHKIPSLWTQLYDLTLIQLSNWRWSWRSMVVIGMAAPVMSITALSVFARDSGVQTLGYILTGNMVLALMFETIGKVSSNFSFMRQVGMLNYFASLPIHRAALVAATVAAFTLLSLPAVLVTLLYGALYLQIPVHLHGLIVLVIPLAAISLAGFGALIGVAAPTPEAANAMNLLLTMVLIGLGPVMVPPDRLPPIMIWVGQFSPATYAASALRQVVIGPVTGRLALDLVILTVVSLAVFFLVNRKMDWRQE